MDTKTNVLNHINSILNEYKDEVARLQSTMLNDFRKFVISGKAAILIDFQVYTELLEMLAETVKKSKDDHELLNEITTNLKSVENTFNQDAIHEPNGTESIMCHFAELRAYNRFRKDLKNVKTRLKLNIKANESKG